MYTDRYVEIPACIFQIVFGAVVGDRGGGGGQYLIRKFRNSNSLILSYAYEN